MHYWPRPAGYAWSSITSMKGLRNPTWQPSSRSRGPRWRPGVNYLPYGEAGWSTAPAPHIRRARTHTAVAGIIESLRRERKWSVRRIPNTYWLWGTSRTCTPWADGWPGWGLLAARSHLGRVQPGATTLADSCGLTQAHEPPGCEKSGQTTPTAAGAHGRGSFTGKATKRGPGVRGGHTYLHSAMNASHPQSGALTFHGNIHGFRLHKPLRSGESDQTMFSATSQL